MQKYFEKIKERFRTYTGKINLDFGKRGKYDFMEVDSAIEIVNQVAKEFATDTNVGSKDEWIPVSSGTLPEEREIVQVTYLSFLDGKTPHCNAFAYRKEGGWKWLFNDGEVKVEIVAWKYGCKPYQPKGEK